MTPRTTHLAKAPSELYAGCGDKNAGYSAAHGGEEVGVARPRGQSISTETKINRMVRRIARRFAPDKIILFGSHARGTPGPDSDVDLLVVMPVQGSKREKQIEIGVALHDIRIPKDIVVATPDEVRRRKDIVGTIIRPALREGRVLYVRGK